MGKYYSRHGRSLYIYVTQDDVLIDLDFFPKEMNLFDTEAAWRIVDRMAVVNDADETSIDKAEIILSLNSFRRWDHPEELLEQYFALGDESVLGEKAVVAPEIAPEPAEEPRLEEMEVIIPRAIAPMPSPRTVVPEGEEEDMTPPVTGRTVGTPIPRREEPSQREMDLVTELMTDEIRGFTDTAYSSVSDYIGRSLADCFNHVEAHWNELEQILDSIAASPQYTPLMRRVKKRIDVVEDLDPETVDSIMRELDILKDLEGRGPSYREMLNGLPLRVSVEEELPDYDVVENRVLKSHLGAIVSRLGELLEVAKTRDSYLRIGVKRSGGEDTVATAREFISNHEVMGAIERLKEGIEGRLEEPAMAFLKQLKQHSGPITSARASPTRPDYGRFYALLESYEESAPPPPVRFELKIEKLLESSNIYAMWSAVRIFGALMELGYKIEIESLTTLSRDETKVDEGFEVILLGKDSEIRLAYEKLYKREPPYGSYSTPKKVTLAVEVFRGDVVPRVIVFEPRYDLDYSIDRFRVEDLGRLHVLRDSIVDLRNDEHDRIVVGGLVLHPAPAETVRYDDLAGMSLRPGATGNPLVEILRGFLETV